MIRQRRRATRSPCKVRQRRPARLLLVGLAAAVVAGGGGAYASTAVFGDHRVGTQYATGLQISSDQVIKPLGERLVSKYGKFIGSAVSPDQRFLAASSTDKAVVLQIFDLTTYTPIWLVGSAAGVNQKLDGRSVGQEGPTYSPDGKFLWLPQTNGLTRFAVNTDGTLGTATSIPLQTRSITPSPTSELSELSALPGKAVYSPDGATLYVAVNGQNTVVALDPATGSV